MPKISLQKGERLIAEIQANRVLYDSKHKDYSDLSLKTKVWNMVAAKCGMRTGHEAKAMWKNLRDCYRISRSKQNVNPNIRPWRFFQQMEFLAPYIKYRKIADESLLDASLPIKDADDKPPVDVPLDINDTGEFTTVFYWNDEANKEKEITNGTANHDEQEMDAPEPEVESRLQSPFDTDSFVDVLPDGLQEGEGENSLKMFFDAMYASTSGLPLRLQRAVKKKIFSAVLEAEEEAEQLHDSAQGGARRIKIEP